jgi:hypothetical protein
LRRSNGILVAFGCGVRRFGVTPAPKDIKNLAECALFFATQARHPLESQRKTGLF